MKVLVVRQPAAWLIVNGYKVYENRSKRLHYRGPLLIQAAAGMGDGEAIQHFSKIAKSKGIRLPETYDHGGIIGICEMVGCVEEARSVWFQGPYGWKLSNARPLDFVPMSGQLGIFDPPAEVVAQIRKRHPGVLERYEEFGRKALGAD